MSDENKGPEDLRNEYNDLGHTMRHYGNIRFAQLTLYFALNAGLFTAAFGTAPPAPDRVRLAAKIVGVIAAIAFATMEERASQYWRRLQVRAKAIEKVLGYEQHRRRPEATVFSATNATRLLLLTGLVLWGFALVSKA
jgi:hypothetical protein